MRTSLDHRKFAGEISMEIVALRDEEAKIRARLAEIMEGIELRKLVSSFHMQKVKELMAQEQPNNVASEEKAPPEVELPQEEKTTLDKIFEAFESSDMESLTINELAVATGRAKASVSKVLYQKHPDKFDRESTPGEETRFRPVADQQLIKQPTQYEQVAQYIRQNGPSSRQRILEATSEGAVRNYLRSNFFQKLENGLWAIK